MSHSDSPDRDYDQLSAEEKRGLLADLLQEEQKTPDRYPASFAQERLWFLNRLQSESAAYTLASALRLHGPLDVDALRKSVDRVAERHDALRTRFASDDDGPVQVVDPALSPHVQIVDVSGVPSDERLALARRRARKEARAPFDLTDGPLARLSLLRLGPDDAILVFAMHHIVSDRVSIEILIREVSAYYRQETEGAAPDLPELPVQYGDFAAWQREEMEGETLQELLDYWTDALDGLPPELDLPTDYPRPPVQTFDGDAHTFDVPDSVAERVESLAQDEGVTLFMTLLAAFYVLLYRYTGQNDVPVGTPVDNRGRSEIEDLIGFFVNTLVLRGDLSDSPSFRELLSRVRETTLDAYEHRHVPFAEVVEALESERSLSRQSLFQVMFSVGHEEHSALDLPGVEVSPVDVEQGTEQFDLNLRLTRTGDGLEGLLSYSTDLFEPATIRQMARHYVRLLDAAVTDPDRPVSALPMMEDEERDRVLGEWNDTEQPLPDHPVVHRAITETARERPGAVALVRDDRRGSRQWTYGALHDRATRLARALVREGIEPGMRVGLHLERSEDVPVAMLGVLLAGGTYVPLDPDYPADRIRYILNDAGAALVLTDDSASDPIAGASTPTRTVDDLLSGSDSAGSALAEVSLPDVDPESLAYVIYTSGSTGRPKGVEIPHRAAVNFLTAMTDRAGTGEPAEAARWLAVTTISFDISVLELLWTLARGHRVVLSEPLRAPASTGDASGIPVGGDGAAGTASDAPPARRRGDRDGEMEFGLFYFANDAKGEGEDPYRLLLEGADFADEHGLSAIWTPERHFARFGGLYPNPSVTGSAIASRTDNVDVRAGSVVMPLHHPVRVAEEFSVIDNLAGGNAGISFASGWHRNDFVFAPDSYENRKDVTFEGLDTVRRLWRGETVTVPGVDGDPVDVSIHPSPQSDELPAWITSGGNPETFRRAGKNGAYLLTHLLGQDLDELSEKIDGYREAWEAAGHPPGEAHVSIMLHSYVGTADEAVRDVVREPFKDYLKRSIGLLKQLASAVGKSPDEELTAEEIDTIAGIAFRRYYETSGLMGPVDECAEQARRLHAAGVDEIGCLIDFGVGGDRVLDGLPNLLRARERANDPDAQIAVPGDGASTYASRTDDGTSDTAAPIRRPLAEQIERHRITHLQGTPSMALQMTDDRSLEALCELDALLLGGETFPDTLADTLEATPEEADSAPESPRLLNMYGPTETTVWSAVHELDGERPVPIGTPVANTRVYVVDEQMRPVPPGVRGELLIGGEGVARGYHDRPRQTAAAFVPDPFADASSGESGRRLYRTGDVVAWRRDGTLAFYGRRDHQVKIRGHRVELEEVSATLEAHEAVREAVSTVDGDGADARLVSYVTSVADSDPASGESEEAPGTADGLGTPWSHPDGEAVLDGHERYTLPDGRVVAHQEAHVTSGLYDEIFRTNTYLRHGLTIDDGATVFDVGANVGMFALFADTVAEDVTVHAFEPIPETCEVLRANAALHQIDGSVHEVGLAEREGEATFTYYPHTSGLSSRYGDAERDREVARAVIREGWEAQVDGADADALPDAQIDRMLEERFEHREVTCRLRTLSGVLADTDVETIDLLKIDVERGEVDVLRGIDDADWPKIRRIVLEADTEETLQACQSLLEEHGFAYRTQPLVVTGRDDDGDPRRVHLLYAAQSDDHLTDETASGPLAWSDASVASDDSAPSDESAADGQPAVDSGALRRHAQQHLPKYMVPQQVVALDALPLTPNGKVDRSELPDPAAAGADSGRGSTEHVEVDGDVEETISQVWQDVLEIGRVGARDNFFELGGTSLQMALVYRRLTDEVDASLTLVDLFQYPTVRSLAQHVLAGDEGGDGGRAADVQSRVEKRRQAREARGRT